MKQVIRDYQLLKRIGRGGFAEVYQAKHTVIDRDVAIKVILPEHANNPDFIRQFHTEATLVGNLEHPHIVPLYDFWHDADGAYLVMRWMRGGNLAERLQQGSLAVTTVMQWSRQIALALAVAHQAGIIHRDIKPANILLDASDNAYLADFGIAKNLTLAQITQTQNPLTPYYAAPEQFSGEPVTTATDIYAFAIMIYELLVGEPPFMGNITEILYAHLNKGLPAINDRVPEMPPSVQHVLDAATAKAPENRYQDVQVFWDDLEAAVQSPTATVVLPQQPQPANPFFNRGAVRDADYFFGRETQTRQLISLLQTGQSISIIGQRRIGKTSLLMHILNEQVLQQHQVDTQALLFVYLDCGTLITLNPAELYRMLLEEIEDVLLDKNQQHAQFPILDKQHPLRYRDFERTLRSFFRDNWRLVLIFDEFELLSRNEHLGNEFFTGLRALAMRYPLTYITASRQPLLDLTYADESSLSSPFFNIFATIRLGLFSDTEANDLLHTLSEQVGQPFSDELCQTLNTTVGRNPLFLNIAGYHCLEQTELAIALRHIRDDITPHLEYYWRSLDPYEQHALLTLPTAIDRNADVLNHLVQMSLLVRDSEGRYEYFSELFKTFIFAQTFAGLIQAGETIIDEERREVLCHGAILELTPLQYELLRVLIQNHGQVMTNQQLEEALWHDEYVDDPERLKSVIKGLRRALGEQSQHLDNVRGVGYQWLVAL